MNITCPTCNLTSSISDTNVPKAGIYAVCPKCSERFLVKVDSEPSWDFTFDPVDPASGLAPDALGDTSNAWFGGMGASAGPIHSNPDADIRTFIGKNADKYLKKFDKFEKDGKDCFGLTWHWPAFLVPFWWLIYRKQYWWAALAFVISFIPFVGILSMLVFGLTANYIYYSYSKNKLREINRIPSEMTRAIEIARAGGVNNIAVVLVPLIGVAILGILAAIAIPQFAAYRIKSYNSVAMTELQKARTSVDTYYAEHRAYPESLEQAHYTQMPGIDVHFDDRTMDRYTLVATHVRGDREYAAKSDGSGFSYRLNREKGSEFRPLN